MGYFVTFHWIWLAGASVIGLGMGWIAIAQRGTGLSKRAMQIAAAVLMLAVVSSAARLVPGRFGYWLDLGLVMLAVYFVGCAIGSWLRERMVWRSAPLR
jgi:hypothetical protein